MLGDGTCDNERNIEPCGYDFSDCCSCDGSEEPCSSECMKSQCKYDETCSDQFLKDSTKYLQLIKSNFYYELGFTPCYNKDSNCDETKLREFYAGTGTDMTACTSLVCLFSENGGEVGVIQNSSGYLKVASSSRSTLEAEEQSSQLIAQSRSKVSQRWTSSRSLKELSSVSLKATSISLPQRSRTSIRQLSTSRGSTPSNFQAQSSRGELRQQPLLSRSSTSNKPPSTRRRSDTIGRRPRTLVSASRA
mmetsp:Transcript_20337/g.37987  ORF Transcript_20337/g.37987 Transcript_20337/m.37987 type:complete len:248 (-) Transcript_20337:2441-3184(-)